MARFTADLVETFWADAEPTVARDHFGHAEAIAANYGDLASWTDLGDGAVSFVLPKKNHGITTFEGRYTCVWRRDGEDTLVWHTRDESGTNLWSSGRAVFTTEGGRTKIRYQQRTVIELAVGRLVAKALNPVIRELTKRELRSYVHRMVATA